MPDCPVRLENKDIGILRWRYDGKNIVFRGSCPFEEGYIYRLSLTDGYDNLFYLGIMMPENGRFAFSKRIPEDKCPLIKNRDAFAVVDRRRPGEEKTQTLSFSDFRPVESETGFGSLIDEAFMRSGGVYAAYKGKGYFAAPWEPGQELIPSVFFSNLTYVTYKGRGYVILCADKEGKPLTYIGGV